MFIVPIFNLLCNCLAVLWKNDGLANCGKFISYLVILIYVFVTCLSLIFALYATTVLIWYEQVIDGQITLYFLVGEEILEGFIDVIFTLIIMIGN